MAPHDRDDPDDEDTDRRRPIAIRAHRHRHTAPGGVPVRVDPERSVRIDWPDPDHVDAESLRRAGYDPAEPPARAEISALVHQLAKRLRSEFSELLTEVPGDIAGQVEKRVAILERDFDPVRRIGRMAAGGALAALVAVVVFVYQRGREEQHVTDELLRLGRLVDKLEQKLESQQTGPRP